MNFVQSLLDTRARNSQNFIRPHKNLKPDSLSCGHGMFCTIYVKEVILDNIITKGDANKANCIYLPVYCDLTSIG